MAVSHGQYRDRRASNISQVILVRLTDPLLPLFRRRALCVDVETRGINTEPFGRRHFPLDIEILSAIGYRLVGVEIPVMNDGGVGRRERQRFIYLSTPIVALSR